MRARCVFFVLTACATPAHPLGDASSKHEPCCGTPVEVTPPTDADRRAGNVATLNGSFAGEGMGRAAEWTCLKTGGQSPRSIHGPFTTEIRASAHELQRLVVGGMPILIHVPPRGELDIAYHPCANWMLVALWLDSASTDGEEAIGFDRAHPCPAGFVEGGDIHEAAMQDRHDLRRCLRGAQLKLDAAASRELRFEDDASRPLRPGMTTWWTPYGGFCPEFSTVDTGTERLLIAPGVGERWHLTIDPDGHLRGVAR